MKYQAQPITDGLLMPEEPMIFLPFGVSIMSFRAMRWQYLIRQMRDIRLFIEWMEENMHEEVVYPFIKDPEVLYEIHDLCLYVIRTDYEGMLDVKRNKYYKFPDSWQGGGEVPRQLFCHVHPANYCTGADDERTKDFRNYNNPWQREVRAGREPTFHHSTYKCPNEWLKRGYDWTRHQRLGSALNIYRPRVTDILDRLYVEQKDWRQVITGVILEYPVTYADYIEYQALRFCSPV